MIAIAQMIQLDLYCYPRTLEEDFLFQNFVGSSLPFFIFLMEGFEYCLKVKKKILVIFDRGTGQSWAVCPKNGPKTLLFQQFVSSELDVVETSNNYVSTAFLQAHKRVWGAKALRVRLQLQKTHGSWPNFEILRKRQFFHVKRRTALNIEKSSIFISWNERLIVYNHFLLYILCYNISPFVPNKLMKNGKQPFFA